MAEISKITLPSGNTYNIKDAYARELIAGGISFIVAWNGTSTPVVANIPAGVVVTYNGTNYTGTLAASSAQPGAFYLVKSSTQKGALDVYDEYAVIGSGSSKAWEKIGDTQLDLSDLGALAYKDNVTLNKGTGDNVLGEATTFTNAASAVSFSGGSTDKVLGSDATFSTAVTPTTKHLTGIIGIVEVGADGTSNAITGLGTPSTENFVKSVSAETSNKLVTTTVPNVTSAGSASTWQFAMGSGDEAETLIISGANSVAPTLGTAKTVATGSVSSSGTGSAVVTDVTVGQSAAAITALGTPTTAACLTGVQVTQQPSLTLLASSNAVIDMTTHEERSIPFTQGIASATTTVNNKDEVTAVTGLGTATAAAQTITVGTNDNVKVAKFDDLSVSAS